MNITFKNTGDTPIIIRDLALHIKKGEEADLSGYQTRELLSSLDLPTAMSSENVEVKINNILVNHNTMAAKLTSMTAADHETLQTLKHNVSQDYYFETVKNTAGQTAFITYYADSSKSLKIREEEILRNDAGSVSEIIIREYDSLGIPVVTERQILNRGATGKVENITVTT